MKLLNKYNRVNIITTIVVVVISSVVYYFFINAALIHQLDKSLLGEEDEIREYVTENKQLPEPSDSKDEQEEFIPVTETVKRSFTSVSDPGKNHHHEIYYRQLQFPFNANGVNYKILVRKSQEETEDLQELILWITLAIVVFLLMTLYLVNRFLLKKLWQPFYNTLEQLKKFNIAVKNQITFENTNTTEFKELNNAVGIMTKKAANDYDEIKSFTENASHEIQTPLAIISSKIELLHQTNLEESQAKYVQVISDTVNRLSKLNQSLILLTKIDNRQFASPRRINLSKVIEAIINNFDELLQTKNITLTKKLPEEFIVKMNETLADVLLLNLITNSIKHNIENGAICIELQDDSLIISNTGLPPEAQTASYFERFKKGSARSDSLGLGLSIVKKICEVYDFKIQYDFHNGNHIVCIFF